MIKMSETYAPEIDALILVHVPVTDLKKSVDFYVNVLGFELLYPERPLEGMVFFKINSGGARLVLVEAPKRHHLHWTDENGKPHICLEMHSKNINGLYEKLKEAGVKVTEPRFEGCGGYLEFYDPDGHYILVNQDRKYCDY
jgi:catechol 2,3-dioxygenase-like lactoylglutathione lyase family enzyme